MSEQATTTADPSEENDLQEAVEEITSFSQLGLSEETLQSIADAGYETPTPVQAHAIPVIMGGTDVVAQAQTGTGKTAAFTIPLIEILDPSGPPTQALILAPTRELAKQVMREFETLGKGRGVQAYAIYGGVPFEPQIEALKKAHVIVATPGRLLDHIRKRNIDLNNLRYFVLDEADEMLSMGFEKEVTELIRQLPSERRNLLFSATMPQAVVRFAENFIRDAERLDLSSDSVGATSVHHVYFQISESARVAALRTLLRSRTVTGAIIFANTKVETFRVMEILEEEGYSVGVLNGDLPQNQREEVLSKLREESLDFLVATDIAARGIDISWLRSVINYDMPDQPETYIHRTGRTGRAGLVGTAYSLVTPGDISVFHYLHKFFDLKLEKRPLPTQEDIFKAQADRGIEICLGSLIDTDDISYGKYLSLARRLAQTNDGHRTVAKLVALYRDGSLGDAAEAETPAVSAVQSQAASKQDQQRTESRDRNDSRKPDHKGSGEQKRRQDDGANRDQKDGRRQDDNPRHDNDQGRQASKDDGRARQDNNQRSKDTQRGDRDSQSNSQPQQSDNQRKQSASKPDSSAASTKQPSSGQLPTADEVRLWIYENSRGRNRWRSVKAIADALGATEEDIDRICDGHKRLKRTSGKRQMWKVLKPYPPEEAQERLPAASSVELGPPSSYVKVKINLGENVVNSPDELVNTMVQLAGFDHEDFGRTDVKAKHSIVEVSEAYWRDILDALQNQQWKGQRIRIRKL